MQILKALRGETKGWVNHPATVMWRGYEEALELYKDVMIGEWIHRGYKNTMDWKMIHRTVMPMPLWIGDLDFHASHRANLLRKDFDFYSQYGWTEDPHLPYIWPGDIHELNQG